MKKIIVVGSINVVLIVFQFILISLISTDGEKVWQATKERTRIESENQILKQEIYSKSALQSITARAEELSLEPIKTEFWKGPVVAQANQ